MSSIRSGELGSPTNSFRARAKALRTDRLTIWSRLVVGVIAILSLGVFASGASASGTVTLPGGPLIVSVGSVGQCQSNYLNAGNNFFPGEGTVGDCGFFLGFPKAGNPAALTEKVYGFQGVAGPGLGETEYTALSPGTPTGSGTAADPYELVTTFKVSDPEQTKENDYVLITETTTYINGEPQFTSTFDVENVTGQTISGLSTAPATTLKFHAIYAGDLFTDDSDFGTGVFLGGPPRFIGGQNSTTGVLGGLIEAASPSPPWTNYQTGCWDVVPEERCPVTSPADAGIWPSVRAASSEGPVFNDDVDPNLIDNAVGVSWDEHLSSALAPGAHAIYSIINRAQIPTGLGVQPVNQTLTVGQTGTVNVTATDNVGTPYANRSLFYTIGGVNPQSGKVTTNASGVAAISYVGAKPGLDTIQMYLDLAGTGTQEPQDPASAAQITWLPVPPAPTPNSTYKIQSIKANSNGTVTIVFIPAQGGKGEVVVTVPTGTIASNNAIASVAKKAKKCKKTQIKVKGKCQPKITVSGKVSATGVAGVPLTLTVKPSGKVTSALKKGKTVHLTATLTYTSALGGVPTVQTFHVTVKGKKAKKGHKKH